MVRHVHVEPRTFFKQTSAIFMQYHTGFWCVCVDTASAEQQRPTSMKQEEDDADDVAMDTEEEKEMQAVDAPELKPEKMESSKASQKGR